MCLEASWSGLAKPADTCPRAYDLAEASVTKLEAFLLIVAFLVVVLGYIWRRLGEPSPPYVEVPPDKRTGLDG